MRTTVPTALGPLEVDAIDLAAPVRPSSEGDVWYYEGRCPDCAAFLSSIRFSDKTLHGKCARCSRMNEFKYRRLLVENVPRRCSMCGGIVFAESDTGGKVCFGQGADGKMIRHTCGIVL